MNSLSAMSELRTLHASNKRVFQFPKMHEPLRLIGFQGTMQFAGVFSRALE
jgi:hypothetical protein